MCLDSYEKEVSLDINRHYCMPENISIIEFEDKFLVIAVDLGNWIVLHNAQQLEIFDYLKLNSIKDMIHKFSNYEEDFMKVLLELEAKEFTDRNVQKIHHISGLCIYLTNECNLRCKHCYMFSGEELENELSTEEIEKLLLEFKKNGGKSVTFTGGEVTLRKDFPDILLKANSIDLKVTVLSNGTLWSDNIVNTVSKYLNEVQFSIDGYDEKTSSLIRGIGVFDKTREAIDTMLKKGVKTTLAITPLYDTLKEHKQEYIEFARNLIDKYNNKDFQVKISYELIEGRNLKDTHLINNHYRKLTNDLIEAVYPGTESNAFVLNHENKVIFDNCGYGGITISASGEVYFCNRISEINGYGNIRDLDFGDIINMSIKAANNSNINNLRPCNSCDLKYICGGGCRIKHFPQVTRTKDLFNFNHNDIEARTCLMEDKEKYYKLMIETNEQLYR